MKDLFDKKLEIARHKLTQSDLIIYKTIWYKGKINYDCLVPQLDSKGNIEFCSATYDETDIEMI